MTQQFEPFQKVLVRNYGEDEYPWRAALFSHQEDDVFSACGRYWDRCIPYEGNEHLLGTLDNPKEKPEPEFRFGDKVEVSENGIDWYKAIYFHKTDVLDLFPHVVIRDNGRRHELFKHCRKADW